jgi:heat shock protein HslJ
MTDFINMANKSNSKFLESNMFSITKIILFPLMLFILAVASGCNSADREGGFSTSSNDLILLQNAKAKWDSQSPQFYTIQSHRSCECEDELSTQMNVSVSDNLVLSAIDIATDEVISKEVQEKIQTVDNLFVLIEKAIADGISIDVTYNEQYGFPETAKIDLEQLSVDGGLDITLSNLDIKNSVLALDDVTWALESFNSIAGPQPIIEGTNISMSIDMEKMQLNGTGGCNSYSADFVIDDKNHDISISNVISTEMVCTEPENVMQQELSYYATLGQIRFFTFEQTTFNMVVGADAGLHFVAEQHSAAQAKIENTSDDFTSLQSAKTKWTSRAGQYYTIQSQRLCRCAADMSAHMEIGVLDNTVLSAFDLDSGDVISKDTQVEIQTVDSLFTLIEKALTDGISIEVIYNEEYGYPESAKIDLEQLAVDGGLHITLSNLDIKDSALALDDVTWALESFDSIAGPQLIIENTNISLSIDMETMQLNGTGGCNSYSADVAIDDKNHDISIFNVISTEMVCTEPENIMQQERDYFATLEQVRFFNFYSASLNMAVGGDAGLHFVVSD